MIREEDIILGKRVKKLLIELEKSAYSLAKDIGMSRQQLHL